MRSTLTLNAYRRKDVGTETARDAEGGGGETEIGTGEGKGVATLPIKWRL